MIHYTYQGSNSKTKTLYKWGNLWVVVTTKSFATSATKGWVGGVCSQCMSMIHYTYQGSNSKTKTLYTWGNLWVVTVFCNIGYKGWVGGSSRCMSMIHYAYQGSNSKTKTLYKWGNLVVDGNHQVFCNIGYKRGGWVVVADVWAWFTTPTNAAAIVRRRHYINGEIYGWLVTTQFVLRHRLQRGGGWVAIVADAWAWFTTPTKAAIVRRRHYINGEIFGWLVTTKFVLPTKGWVGVWPL